MDQLQNIVNQTAINTRSISQQLGIIASAVTDLKAHADQTDPGIGRLPEPVDCLDPEHRQNVVQGPLDRKHSLPKYDDCGQGTNDGDVEDDPVSMRPLQAPIKEEGNENGNRQTDRNSE